MHFSIDVNSKIFISVFLIVLLKEIKAFGKSLHVVSSLL